MNAHRHDVATDTPTDTGDKHDESGDMSRVVGEVSAATVARTFAGTVTQRASDMGGGASLARGVGRCARCAHAGGAQATVRCGTKRADAAGWQLTMDKGIDPHARRVAQRQRESACAGDMAGTRSKRMESCHTHEARAITQPTPACCGATLRLGPHAADTNHARCVRRN